MSGSAPTLLEESAYQAGGTLPDTSTVVSGTASWYCGGGSACTRGYPEGTLAAAAGPALRVGDWRGRIVKVCGNGRCVKVILADWCACPQRVIDLYRSAFSRLASPSRGLLRVEVTWGGVTIGLPPTDTR
jgi:rare lipoprotein A (peptidoglycan hydrolase)